MMQVYTFTEARRNLSKVLDRAKTEDVFIRRRSGELFRVSLQPRRDSPFNVEGVKTKVRTADILNVIRAGRKR